MAGRPLDWWPEHADRPAGIDPGRALARLAGSGRSTLLALWHGGVDLVLPPTCPSCRRRLGGAGGLCFDCWQSVRFIERPWCERLGTPMPIDLGPGVLSAGAIAAPPPFGRARAAIAYEGVAVELIQAFKYRDHTDLAPMFGGWMTRVAGELAEGADALVPVPLHWSRLLSRRYNQAALLARIVAPRIGVPCRTDLVVRVRRTPRQVGLDETARHANVRGAFAVPERKRALVAGKRLILVDDVFTTGSTLGAATRALLAAGAAGVDVLTLARVVGPVETGL
jgi:ComF family protein